MEDLWSNFVLIMTWSSESIRLIERFEVLDIVKKGLILSTDIP